MKTKKTSVQTEQTNDLNESLVPNHQGKDGKTPLKSKLVLIMFLGILVFGSLVYFLPMFLGNSNGLKFLGNSNGLKAALTSTSELDTFNNVSIKQDLSVNGNLSVDGDFKLKTTSLNSENRGYNFDDLKVKNMKTDALITTENVTMEKNLTINGAIKIGSIKDVTCADLYSGAIQYNSATKSLEFCDGTEWNTVVTNNNANINENEEAQITPVWKCGEKKHYAGKDYLTVQIGAQCWFAENLNAGIMLDSPRMQQKNNNIIEKWCSGDEGLTATSSDCDTYGGLYTWDEAMDYGTIEGAQGICPAGWHIPTDAEYKILVDSQSTPGCETSDWNDWQCYPAGDKLLSTAVNFSNASGFTALLVGIAHPNEDDIYKKGTDTYFWTSKINASNAWVRGLSSSNTSVHRTFLNSSYGLSVRCLKD